MANCFFGADIMLPRFKDDKDKMNKWATVACDQYTSEADYWAAVEKKVGDAPSALRITLPEIYLGDRDEERIEKINKTMVDYTENLLEAYPDSMIYLERKLADGRVRRGIIGKIDLDEYDYNKGATTLVRATEGTVLSRIPPRVKIRRGATVELPHIMMLIDDPDKTVIEPLIAKKCSLEPAYSFELMQNGGYVDGYFIDTDSKAKIDAALEKLSDIDAYNKKYGTNEKSPMLFAVGDGNHSLASAKALYEEIKAELGAEAAKNHPARYALCEIVNIHDAALEFEPIYRVVFDTDVSKMTAALKEYAKADKGGKNSFDVECVSANGTETIRIENSANELAVGALQDFIDAYLKENKGEVDYIHGVGSTKTLAAKENAIGFLFEGMGKNELFKSVIINGSLPRKTFSMGEADDKRYYLEARKIVK